MNLFQLGNLPHIFLMQISKKTCNSLDCNKNVKKQKHAVTKHVSITTVRKLIEAGCHKRGKSLAF